MSLINLLGLEVHFNEHRRLATIEEFGPDASRESTEEMVMECQLIPIRARSEFIEINNILGDPVVVLHGKIAKGCFGIPTEIVRSEMVCELLNECVIIVEPIRNVTDVTHNDRFKPI